MNGSRTGRDGTRPNFFRRVLLISYILALHAGVLVLVWNPGLPKRIHDALSGTSGPLEIDVHHERMLRFHIRMESNVPDGAVVFIGDSLVQGLATDAVAVPSVNFGIGGDTTQGVLARLPSYDVLQRAAVIVMAIGVNDMKYRDNDAIRDNYLKILDALPSAIPVVWSAVLPVSEPFKLSPHITNTRINSLNRQLEALCARDSRCHFVPAGAALVDKRGNLLGSVHEGDGIHLNGAGNRIWIQALRTAVADARRPMSGTTNH